VEGDRLHAQLMINRVEKRFDIKVNDPAEFPTALPAYRQRVMRTATRTITIGVRIEDRLDRLLQLRSGHRLRDPIRDRGDGGFILPLLQLIVGLVW
jgi:hypothetical protein